jgi:hypothetical protein
MVLRWTLGKICRGPIRGESKILFADYRITIHEAIDYQGYKHYIHRKIAPLFAFG